MKLQENKMYVLCSIGDGFIARKIQELSDSSLVQSFERCVHVAACYNNAVIESHFQYNGVIQTPFLAWKKMYEKQKVFAFEYPYLSWDKLEVYAKLKIPYGTLDLASMWISRWTDLCLSDFNGVHCAELLAECDKDFITNYFKLEDSKIKPVNFQEYSIKEKLEIINL